jgi:hypothetical protein
MPHFQKKEETLLMRLFQPPGRPFKERPVETVEEVCNHEKKSSAKEYYSRLHLTLSGILCVSSEERHSFIWQNYDA